MENSPFYLIGRLEGFISSKYDSREKITKEDLIKIKEITERLTTLLPNLF